MKKYFNILLYISFIFVVFFLYKYDFLKVKDVKFNWTLLVVSMLLLWAGALLSSISWWNGLRKHQVFIDWRNGTISHGLSIFAKYIPGKIWVILGRAYYVSTGGFSLKVTSLASVQEQLIYVFVGLLISVVPMIFFDGLNEYVIWVLIILVAFSLFIFTDWFHKLVVLIVKKIFKKEIDLPVLGLKENASIMLFCLLYWAFWLAAFYFFVYSIIGQVPLAVMFAFPLSVTLGLLAFIVPGGLGVREGIMTAYLVILGIPVETAVTISVIARLWFITGEVFMFLVALYFQKVSKVPIK